MLLPLVVSGDTADLCDGTAEVNADVVGLDHAAVGFRPVVSPTVGVLAPDDNHGVSDRLGKRCPWIDDPARAPDPAFPKSPVGWAGGVIRLVAHAPLDTSGA